MPGVDVAVLPGWHRPMATSFRCQRPLPHPSGRKDGNTVEPDHRISTTACHANVGRRRIDSDFPSTLVGERDGGWRPSIDAGFAERPAGSCAAHRMDPTATGARQRRAAAHGRIRGLLARSGHSAAAGRCRNSGADLAANGANDSDIAGPPRRRRDMASSITRFVIPMAQYLPLVTGNNGCTAPRPGSA